MLSSLNKKIAERLIEINNSGKTVHAFAFIGGSRDARVSLGEFFSKTLLCSDSSEGYCGKCLSCRKFDHSNHEDFIRLHKPDDRESILKEQVLELIDRLSYKPFGDRYAVLIEDAQLMNNAAQNKLLKSLEEPQSPAVFILLSPTREALLPTILSRCQVYYLSDEGQMFSDKAAAAAEDFLKLLTSQSAYYKKRNVILPFAADKDDGRNSALEFLDALELDIKNLLEKLSQEACDSGFGASYDACDSGSGDSYDAGNPGFGASNVGARDSASYDARNPGLGALAGGTSDKSVAPMGAGSIIRTSAQVLFDNGCDREKLQSRLIGAAKEVQLSRQYLKQLHSVAYTLKQLCLRV